QGHDKPRRTDIKIDELKFTVRQMEPVDGQRQIRGGTFSGRDRRLARWGRLLTDQHGVRERVVKAVVFLADNDVRVLHVHAVDDKVFLRKTERRNLQMD